MLEGSCLCGAVAYEADGGVDALIHCHCESCRKAHGSAFSSIAAAPRAGFRWTRGEDLLKAFESSPGKRRWFCSQCGSHIIAEREGHATVMLRLGCLDTPIEVERQSHIWRSDAATWFDPSRILPELAEGLVRRTTPPTPRGSRTPPP
jgi:ADP-ribosyl-[dinitrogen reductase] hydrolase